MSAQFASALGPHGITAEQAAELHAAGLDLPTVLQWITQYGPEIVQLILTLIGTLKKPTNP